MKGEGAGFPEGWVCEEKRLARLPRCWMKWFLLLQVRKKQLAPQPMRSRMGQLLQAGKRRLAPLWLPWSGRQLLQVGRKKPGRLQLRWMWGRLLRVGRTRWARHPLCWMRKNVLLFGTTKEAVLLEKSGPLNGNLLEVLVESKNMFFEYNSIEGRNCRCVLALVEKDLHVIFFFFGFLTNTRTHNKK
jgi:hypothetical protein